MPRPRLPGRDRQGCPRPPRLAARDPPLHHRKRRRDVMRRIMAAAAVAALVLGAGCSKDSGGAGASSSPTPSASPTLDVAANTKQVCDEVKQLNTDSAKKVGDAIAKATAAAMKGDEANDITKDWVAKLRAAAAKAANPELAKALNDIADQVEKLLGEDATVDQMNKTVQEAGTTLNKYCA